MNFRQLNTEELEPLAYEFKLFLASNGIDATKWEQMKAAQSTAVTDLMKQFSDSVWFKIFCNKRYLDFFENDQYFYLDFLVDHCIIIKAQKKANPAEFQFSLSELKYTLSREEDMYQWMQQGAEFSDGKAYKEACILWAEAKK